MVNAAKIVKNIRDQMSLPKAAEPVVVEALAAGVVPLVADFGGPGDTVRPDVGFKVPLTNESEVVSQMEKHLGELVHHRNLLYQLRERSMSYVREALTWEAKGPASAVTRESCIGS